MYRAAKLVSLTAGDLQLVSYAGAEVGAVLSASGGTVISGGYDVIVLYDDSSEGLAKAGASGCYRLCYIKVIVFF